MSMSIYSGNSFLKIVWLHFITWLEKISYGLYLTHMIALNIIIAIFTKEAEFILLKNLLTIVLTILTCYVSYFTIEKCFLSLKNKVSDERDNTSF